MKTKIYYCKDNPEFESETMPKYEIISWVNNLFGSPNPETDEWNVMSENDSVSIYIGKEKFLSAHIYDTPTKKDFKSKYGMSLIDALRKATYIEWGNDCGTYIWTNQPNEFLEYLGWYSDKSKIPVE